jgi:hypothetical protein
MLFKFATALTVLLVIFFGLHSVVGFAQLCDGVGTKCFTWDHVDPPYPGYCCESHNEIRYVICSYPSAVADATSGGPGVQCGDLVEIEITLIGPRCVTLLDPASCGGDLGENTCVPDLCPSR